MSADNWTRCPRCIEKAKRDHDALCIKVRESYGKVAAEEYLELLERSLTMPTVEQTFSEYYELGICEDGEFYVSYSGSCSNCGFSHTFKHSEQLNLSITGDKR